MGSKELQSIPIYAADFAGTLARIPKGCSYEHVNLVLGGEAYKTERRDNKKVFFWRFKILDATEPYAQYEIYMGEFEEGKLVFGAILPRG